MEIIMYRFIDIFTMNAGNSKHFTKLIVNTDDSTLFVIYGNIMYLFYYNFARFTMSAK